MVDATCGTGGVNSNTMSADQLEIQENVLDTSALAEHDPVLSNAVETLEESFHERMAHLEHQMENTDDPMEKLALEEELMNLEQEFERFESMVENTHLEIDDVGGLMGHMISMTQESGLEALEDMVGDLRSTLMDSYAEFGSVGMPPDGDVAVEGDTYVDEATCEELAGSAYADRSQRAGGTGGSEGAGETAGAGQASGADGGGEMPNPEEMVNLLSNDPQAFMEQLSDMDPEDRNAMMMAVQTQLQEINQMFQMASQFSQAMHDTQKSVIQNMRV